MPSVTVNVPVDVDFEADDLDTEDLIDALHGRDLSPAQRDDLAKILGNGIEDEAAIDNAKAEELGGRHREALIWIERALGSFWIGRLAK